MQWFTRLIITITPLFILIIQPSFSQEKMSLSIIKPVYTETAPVIDGKINDVAWAKATKIPQLRDYQTGKPVKEPTQVYLLYDKDNLYFGFRCNESQMEKTLAKFSTDGQTVFLDDCVEIFLSPNQVATPDHYYHFACNIIGTKYFEILSEPSQQVNWTAKTAKLKDGWTAEIVIPFTSIKNRGKNEAFWRLNIGREEYPSNEVSCWSVTYGTFHSPYRFGILEGIDFNGKFIGLNSRLKPDTNKKGNTGVIPLTPAVSYKPEPVVVIPQPVKMTLTSTDFVINTKTKILTGPSRENLQAAMELNEELKEISGMELPIIQVNQNRVPNYTDSIVLGEPATNPVVSQLVKSLKLKVTPTTPGPEGYVLQVHPKYVLIAGSDIRGTYYGIQSLKQLIRFNQVKDKSILVVKGALIWDKPFFKVRSVHVLLDKESARVHKKMIEKIFARFKLNHLIIETEQGIAWKSHPEIVTSWAMDPLEVKKLVQVANDHLMQVTPLVQSLGHCEWIFRNKVNLDLAEDTSRPTAYCPMNPNSYKFIFDIMDEAIDLFNHPQYVHIGHDEYDQDCKFPTHDECKKAGGENLYYMDTLKIYNHLKSKGIKTMMWGDILWRPSYRKKINELPKDIIIADWHYDPAYTQPSAEFFQKNGLQVLGCTWFDPFNISRFSEYGAKNKILGMMQTTWAGYDQNDTILQREFKQVMAYILSADYAWNPTNRNLQKLPYDTGRVLKQVWWGDKDKYQFQSGFAVNLDTFTNLSLVDSDKSPGFVKYGKGNDLSKLVSTPILHLLDNTHYRISGNKAVVLSSPGIANTFPDRINSIPVHRSAEKLYFLHSTLYSAQQGTEIGKYIIHYTSGDTTSIPLIYMKNINSWLDTNSNESANLAWQGRTSSEQQVSIYSMTWSNPNPDKEISTIDFMNGDTKISPILFAVTGTTKTK